MLGKHLLKTWSSTQPSISLSSGEAEYYGLIKAAGIALGHQSLMRDLGLEVGVRVWTDSSAAMGVCGRAGLGKLRHVQTHTLWVQERVRTGAIQLRKIHGEVNPADLFTKHLTSSDRVTQLTELFNCEYRDGRAESAPMLRKDKLKKVNAVYATYRAPAEYGPKAQDPDDDYAHIPLHDPDVLPHEYLQEDLDQLFPLAVAPEEPDGTAPNQCICHRPECSECFPGAAGQPVRDVSGKESW